MTLEDSLEQTLPAFPVVVADDSDPHTVAWFGMTLHDWFVGQALAGITSDTESFTPEQWKMLAFEVADLVMAERKKRAGE